MRKKPKQHATQARPVDAFFDELKQWAPEMRKLRDIVLDCGLVEELKWGGPCYTAEGANLVVLQPMKTYCALGFMKGTLLKDAKGILVAPGKHSQLMRQARFTNVQDIARLEPTLKVHPRGRRGRARGHASAEGAEGQPRAS